VCATCLLLGVYFFTRASTYACFAGMMARLQLWPVVMVSPESLHRSANLSNQFDQGRVRANRGIDPNL
jgi:hypothetical protein